MILVDTKKISIYGKNVTLDQCYERLYNVLKRAYEQQKSKKC